MKTRTLAALAAALGLALLCSQMALAAPMRCSDQQKTCVAGCGKRTGDTSISTCVTNCAQQKAVCMKSGCWSNGTQRLCGLARQ